MKCISALSTERNTEAALKSAVERAAQHLAGAPADLALIFASMHHADALGRVAQVVRQRGLARHVLGCTGESIVGEDREVEGAAALGLWAIQLPGVAVQPLHIAYDEDTGFRGWPPPSSDINISPASADVRPPSSLILLGDPFTFPADRFLKQLNEEQRGLRVVGGMASGASSPGANRLVLDDAVFVDGAVAVALDGPLAVRTVVSQGCRPIGRPMIVTRVEQNLIRELGRRPAMEVLQELFVSLDARDQELIQQGLHLGRVINEYQEKFQRGDFLVRNVLGTDGKGSIAITDLVRVGQTVQFHVRDADTADEDLRGLLKREREERPDARIKGALLFSCNGRGTRLFPRPNHDVATIHDILGPVPVAGFFAMGEIGPVGGQNFIHGFTASIVLFEEP